VANFHPLVTQKRLEIEHGGRSPFDSFFDKEYNEKNPIKIGCKLKKLLKKILKSPFWPLIKNGGSWNPQNQSHTISHTRNQCIKISKESVHPIKR